ncbi:Uncharacterised protein [Burkholderia pseudomallei]|nr:Uncharacterised protein [Burkholderia pseudomallei]
MVRSHILGQARRNLHQVLLNRYEIREVQLVRFVLHSTVDLLPREQHLALEEISKCIPLIHRNSASCAHVEIFNGVNKKKATSLAQGPYADQLLSKLTHQTFADLLCIYQLTEAAELLDSVIDFFTAVELVEFVAQVWLKYLRPMFDLAEVKNMRRFVINDDVCVVFGIRVLEFRPGFEARAI